MYLTWRERLERHPELKDFGAWPIIDLDSITTRHRQQFNQNKAIVLQGLQGIPFVKIAKHFNLPASSITRKMDRCLGGNEFQPPLLTQGLIPHAKVTQGQRREALPTFSEPSGPQFAFTALLRDIPALPRKLDEMINAKLKDARYAQTLTPATFHGEFKRILIEEGHPTDQYPYTTQKMAAESVRLYFHQRLKALRTLRDRPIPTPTHQTANNLSYRALQTIEIDEHTLDLHQTIHLDLNDELIPLRLSRLQVIVATNVDTDCVMGYHLALSQSPNQQDMLQLLDNCVQPWKPMRLKTPGLAYESGACFPSGLGKDFPVSLHTIKLDNALAHLAHSVQTAICDQQAATFCLGRGRTPKTRRWVEDLFNRVNTQLTHRYASTTGSHPKDPVKESLKNIKKPPVVTLRMLDEALSVILTKHNVTRKKHLGQATPLELYQAHFKNHYIRYLPEQLRSQWHPFMETKTVPLKCLRYDHRPPHINFQGVRYRGEKLLEAAPTHNKIIIEYDRRDIRWLNARTLNGKDLGRLAAPQSWLRFSHGIATRQLINKKVKQHQYHGRDPLAEHFRYLLEQKGSPKIALQMVRVYDEFGRGLSESNNENIPLLIHSTDHVITADEHVLLPRRRVQRWAPHRNVREHVI